MLTFKDLKKKRGGEKPPFILIYAEPNGGKTTLASEFPNPVFLQTEDGTPGEVEINSFGLITEYDELANLIGSLANEEHDFQTAVLDSATALERIVWKETCRRGDEKGISKARIEDFGYGKGYKNADSVWLEIIDGLNTLRKERNMIVVVIGHVSVSRFDDPETSSYSRFELSVHERAAALFENESDIIIFLRQPITTKSEDVGFNKDRAIAQTGRQIMMHLVPRATFKAKSRYLVNAPDKMPYVKGEGFDSLAKYFPGAPPAKEPEAAAETPPADKESASAANDTGAKKASGKKAAA